jgi:peptidoglycan/LPS O-acetylase OafA/YrhL
MFESGRPSRKLYIAAGCTAWIPVNLYLVLLVFPLISPGHHIFSALVDSLLAQSAFLLSLMCLLYLSIGTFRRYLNGGSAVLRELGRSSFEVYIIHTVVLGIIAMALLNSSIPSLLKHVTLSVLTYLTSWAMVFAYRKIRVQAHSFRSVEYDKA